jgi:uncharacterized membrane protein YdbT with pleckstrin-like domain
VDINRGLLARILGLSELQIQTAGASFSFNTRNSMNAIFAEGALPGISKEEAETVREELVKRAKGNKTNQGL